MSNTICNNSNNGIESLSIQNLINDSQIKLNKIQKNGQNGILICGKLNETKVENNFMINNNHENGIKISDKANCVVKNNHIFQNHSLGILVEESAVAKIIKNKIYKNIKSNVAVGGLNSSNVLIVQNYIAESSADGISCYAG